MGIVQKEKYSPSRIENLKLYLSKHAENGMASDYEILLDGLRVVPRTSDISYFDLFEDFVSAHSKCVEIILYRGKSNHNKMYIEASFL
jgi:hypothetical protein